MLDLRPDSKVIADHAPIAKQVVNGNIELPDSYRTEWSTSQLRIFKS